MDVEVDGSDRVVGAVGHVTIPIPPDGPGEVVVAIRGGSEAYAAWADVPVAKHTQVLVVDRRGPRSLLVTPFATAPSHPGERLI